MIQRILPANKGESKWEHQLEECDGMWDLHEGCEMMWDWEGLHLHRIWMTSWMVLLISTLWQYTETQFWMSIKHSVIDILGTHSVVEVAVVYFWDLARNIVQQIVHAFINSQWPHVLRVRSFCWWDKGIAQNLCGWINIHKSAILGYHEGITILTRGHITTLGIPIPVDFAPDSGSSTLKWSSRRQSAFVRRGSIRVF